MFATEGSANNLVSQHVGSRAKRGVWLLADLHGQSRKLGTQERSGLPKRACDSLAKRVSNTHRNLASPPMLASFILCWSGDNRRWRFWSQKVLSAP